LFDVIGDVHGQHEKLVRLLSHLGYSDASGTWQHRSRTAIFVGDLVDRGPKQLETIQLVQSMVQKGSAQCVMGNHEFNAIAWVTPDCDRPGKYLRDRDKRGNREQHAAFLEVVEGTPLHQEITNWFRTLPLWLEFGDLRIVHACWHQPEMDRLSPLMGPNNTLTDELIRLGSRPDHWAFRAIETICKGPEVELPPGVSIKDKSGKARHEVRVRWWLEDLSTYAKAAIGPPEDLGKIPDAPMPPSWRNLRYSGPPVLFGHYWFSGTPQVIAPRFACLDYSAAFDGPLVAYRFDGEKQLTSDKLAWVKP
jgi:Calcineurin-like phosphoesterase